MKTDILATPVDFLQIESGSQQRHELSAFDEEYFEMDRVLENQLYLQSEFTKGKLCWYFYPGQTANCSSTPGTLWIDLDTADKKIFLSFTSLSF